MHRSPSIPYAEEFDFFVFALNAVGFEFRHENVFMSPLIWRQAQIGYFEVFARVKWDFKTS